jgi:hypothetical protein
MESPIEAASFLHFPAEQPDRCPHWHGYPEARIAGGIDLRRNHRISRQSSWSILPK